MWRFLTALWSLKVIYSVPCNFSPCLSLKEPLKESQRGYFVELAPAFSEGRTIHYPEKQHRQDMDRDKTTKTALSVQSSSSFLCLCFYLRCCFDQAPTYTFFYLDRIRNCFEVLLVMDNRRFNKVFSAGIAIRLFLRPVAMHPSWINGFIERGGIKRDKKDGENEADDRNIKMSERKVRRNNA